MKKKRIFDICIFNIDNYVEKDNVFYVFQYNFKLFEKYKEKNENINKKLANDSKVFSNFI